MAPVSQLGALLFGRENCHQSLTSPPRLVDYGGGFWTVGIDTHGRRGISFEDYPLSDEAASMYVETVVDHHESTGCIPDDKTLTIEPREHAIVLNCCRGSRINETLSHFIQAMGSGLGGSMGVAVVDPYRIIQNTRSKASDIEGWLRRPTTRLKPY